MLTREPRDFWQSVAQGSIDGYLPLNKFGRNPDIDIKAAGTFGRDVWDGGVASAADWVPPTAARIHAIAGGATDALDDVGAHTLRIFGLDSAYGFQQEDLSMHATDGTTPVNTTLAYTMIHRMYVLTSGSAGKNVADITATAASDSTLTAQITASNNQTAMAIFQIPAGYTGYLNRTYASIHNSGGVEKLTDSALFLMEFGGVWRLQDSFAASSSGSPTIFNPYQPSLEAPAKSYIKMQASPTFDAQDVSAGFSGVMVDDLTGTY